MKNFFSRKDNESDNEPTVNADVELEESTNRFQMKMSQMNWKKIGIIAGSCCGALLIIYLGFSIFFMSHFYFRSTVNGVSTSAKSASNVENAILTAADTYQLAIIDADDKEEEIDQSDIDMTLNMDGQVAQMLDEQNGFAWVKYLFAPKEYVSTDMVSFDREKLASIVAQLGCVTNTNQTPTENATYEYKGGKYVVKEEVYGTQIDAAQFTKMVGDAIILLKSELVLDEDGCYLQPTVKADSKELKELIKTLNKYIDMDIAYEVGDATEDVSKEEISKWLSADENLQPAFNQEAMLAYVGTMSKKYNTYGQSKSLATSYGTTVTVPGGNYGWKIDKEGEVAQLIEDFKNEKDVKRDFVYAVKANSRGANDYGNSYVEINLTAQHLYLYKDGSLVLETDFVSGNPSKGNASPTGAYKITYTEKDATLNGENYSTPVNYWMPFAGNVGMHDATWRGSFGGTIYKTNGSHGCINLPLSAAKTIFSTIGTGYAVLVYELPGTESKKGVAMDAANAVVNAINSIGEVSLGSEGTITSARGQYDALAEDAKGYVTNYDVLLAAEARLAQLKTDAANASAATERAKADAANVMNLINQIGTVTVQSNNAITTAENAYNALSAEAKTYVTNYQVLIDARAAFIALQS